MKRAETEIARAHTEAAKEVMTAYLKELRDDVKATGFRNSGKLANTWRGRVFPGSDGSMGPIWLYNRSPQIIDAFSLGFEIRASAGKWLAILIGGAVSILRASNLTTNRTRDGFGRFAAEGARIERVATAIGAWLHLIPPRGGKGGVVVGPGGEVLFVLLKSVRPPKRMRSRALLQSFNARVQADFAAALARHV